MKPIGIPENIVPVKFLRTRLRHGGSFPVVDDLASALRCAFFHKINAQPAPAAQDMAGVHAVAAQRIEGALPDFVLRQLADESGIKPILGQRHRRIGLPSGIGGFKRIGLYKAAVSRRVQPHHDFPEADNSFHFDSSLQD